MKINRNKRLTAKHWSDLLFPMNKTIKVKMTDETGNVYFWIVKSFTAISVGAGMRKPRKIRGWSFEDHEGITRNSEGNWTEFVPFFHLIASNYGFQTVLS